MALTASILAIHGLVAESRNGAKRAAAVAAEPPPNLRSVLVARASISRGQRIERALLGMAQVRENGPITGFTRIDDVEGAIALETIHPGQIIHREAISESPDARPGLAMLVPEGMRAIAIRVTEEIAVGNFVRPDDTVDIQLVVPSDQLAKLRGQPASAGTEPESVLLLQNVRVLSVGEGLTVKQGDKAIRMQNLTVAVTPRQALAIAAVKDVGTFYLALRHPNDERQQTETRSGAREAIGLSRATGTATTPGPSGHRIEMILGDHQTYEGAP